MRLYEMQICTDDNGTNPSWRTLGARHTLTQAKRTAAVHTHTFFTGSLGRKVTFEPVEGESSLHAFYADVNGNPVPVPIRLRPYEINEGDLVTMRLHATAEKPDCHYPYNDHEHGNNCTHSHHQVGKVLRVYRSDVSGPVADVDWYEVSHRYAGDEKFPTGVKTTALVILKPVNPFMREHEVLEGVQSELYERHCGGYIPGSTEKCQKPVVRVFWCWADDVPWGSHDSFGEKAVYHQDSWRHADGTGPWDHCTLYPIPLCEQCGYEGEGHCTKCHTKAKTLHVAMEAYGNRTTCAAEGCTYEDWYDIGD